RAAGCDVAVLFPNSFRSAFIARFAGIPRRLGYARHGRSVLLTDAMPPLRDTNGRIAIAPILDAYNRLVAELGAVPGRRMRLFTNKVDEAAAEEVWQKFGLARYPEVIALNPGAAYGAAKHWPTKSFAELGRRLAEERGAGVLVLCGPSERGLARDIVEQAGHRDVHSLSDEKLSIGLTKAIVRRSDLLVTTDSGPRHFAAAFARPVVTLFGPTHIGWTETYHPGAIHLQEEVDCGPCQKRVCPLDHKCMTGLSPDSAFRASIRLLSGHREARRVG
ncbi:MAG: lipopolysaccharide heptosyltransferase II, partial [Gemmataceae bacterium]|nr:lipopolysaccharide heptosyltransferase II [Gemmataceae bacterium]